MMQYYTRVTFRNKPSPAYNRSNDARLSTESFPELQLILVVLHLFHLSNGIPLELANSDDLGNILQSPEILTHTPSSLPFERATTAGSQQFYLSDSSSIVLVLIYEFRQESPLQAWHAAFK